MSAFAAGRLLSKLALAALVLAGSLEAQIAIVQPPGALKRMSVEELLGLKVLSVSRTPEGLGAVPSSVYLIRGESARAAGATALPELLRLAPNLFVAQGSSYDWAVGARGFTRANTRVNKMQVLIDGRTVYSPLFSGVFWDAQDLFLPDLDRIEVISGPAGATWGANAVNGVINITTKSARDTQGGVVYGGLGNELELNLGMRYGARFAAGSAYRVYAKHRSYDDTLAVGAAGPDAWDFSQAGFRIDGGNNRAALEWTLQGDAYRGTYANASGPDARNEGANLLARWDVHFASGTELELRFYHDYSMRRVPGQIWEHLRTSDLEFEHQLQERSGHQVIWGGNYRFMNEDVHVAAGGFTFLPVARDMRLAGLFVQDAFDLVPREVRVTGGVRLEYNSFSKWEVQPSLRAAWQMSPDHTLWTAVSRATRTPSRIDTDFYLPPDPPYAVAGGPEFDSEELTAFELGWRGKLATGVAASLTAYYHDYDKLRSVEVGSPIVLANGLGGRSRGLEASLDWQVREWWRFRIGGFVLDEGTKLRPGATDLEGGLGEASDPDYQVLVRSGLDLSRHVLLWLSLRSLGSVPDYANGVDVGKVPAYTELDATLRWEVRPGVEWLLIGRNLLHGSHPEIGEGTADRHEIERSVHTMIRWDF